MNKVWILTEEYNTYDQFGEYYLALFKNKPTAEVLEEYGVENTEHVLNGGGRSPRMEDHWFHLYEVLPK